MLNLALFITQKALVIYSGRSESYVKYLVARAVFYHLGLFFLVIGANYYQGAY